MTEIPATKLTTYHAATSVETRSANFPNVEYASWWLVNVPGNANWGTVRVNCSHTDTKGSAWSEY